ncbi:MAG TPA: SusC/RagA family TonB-linked outer membrane protein [Parafilimonas sp.]|nr:SusC/RagA family TonB-linked outer membrane protein [Parafilimonas sp.]
MSLLLLVAGSFSAFAQKTISGVVTDSATGRPLPAVSIIVQGTRTGTQTAADGTFKISVPANAVNLVISSVGYANKIVPISSENIFVSLTQINASLNDVVVIGYGTTTKKEVTGSIATVSTKDFQKGSITSPEQLIAGKVAGVSITSNGGQPGAGSVIRIRGGASLNASNDPLIVIDGVPLDGVDFQGINPNDIESFSILKDAAATAIYGSRASNGVIMITTKRGRSGKPMINFNTQFSVSKIQKEYPVLSASQFKNLVDSLGTQTQIDQLGDANTDWQKEIYQTALTTDNNLSIAGGFKNVPYRISGEYLNQQGVLLTDNLQREALSLVVSPYLFDKHLKIDINLHGSNTDSRTANTGAIGNAVSFDPTQSVYSDNKTFGGYFEWMTNDTTPQPLSNRNPVALLKQYDAENHALRSFGNIQFDYKFHFLPDLHANLNLGYDVAKYTGTTNVSVNAAQSYNSVPSLRGQDNQYYNNHTNKVLEFYLNYTKDIPSIKSNINAIAGYGYYDDHYFNRNYYSFSASHDTMPGSKPSYPTSFSDVTLLSYYGRLIYTFNGKYILMGSIRTDGSSRFGPDYRWGVFPSGAFTWRINQEDFLKNSNVVSDLKLRLSYGITGQQDGIPFYSYLNYYALSGNTSQVDFGNNYYNFFNPPPFAADLQWEQTATTDAGFDFGFAKNRITGSADYYYKKTSHLLASVFVPALTNFGNKLTRNVGNMTDKGVDFNINGTVIRNKNFSWDVGFNFAYNEFKITNLSVSQDSLAKAASNIAVGGIAGGTGNTIQVLSVGYNPYTFYVLQQVLGSNGKPIEGLYVDQDRNGTITQPNDLILYKSPYAPFTFGFTTAINYKKWSLNTVLRASVGNYVYNNVASNTAVVRNVLNPVGFLQNAPSSLLNTYFYNNQFFSSYYVENASFLKMDNLGIAYDAGYLSKHSYHLNLSLNCQNVFTVTKYSGSDPEIYGGIDNVIYPRPRVFTLGASITF